MNDDLSKLEIDLTTTGVDKKFQKEVLDALKLVPRIEDYLRETMASDVKRYFNATTPMEQLLVKGAYFRTQFLLKLLQSADQPAKKKVPEIGKRYG